MNRLWAPWRMRYIRKAKKEKRCVFCRAKKQAHTNQVIFKTKHSIVILNIYPYNNGHLMVSPLRHVNDIAKLSFLESSDLWRALVKSKWLLQKVLRPQGFNIGINFGRASGAGITGHMHIHIVPRWEGDTNFMPVFSSTKIISESLEELAKRLKHAYSREN